MPIRPPALDDRRYEDLVAELVERIPAHTPEWTHPRPGDPGRTLIELFAWLGDALLYRVNLIPERQRFAFLQLVGRSLEPARPARGLVTVSLRESEPPVPVRVRPLASFPAVVPFEARSEFTVVPASARAFIKRRPQANEVSADVVQALANFHNQGRAVAPYVTVPLFAGGTPDPDGFDIVAGTTDRSLWLALLAGTAPAGVNQVDFNRTVRAALAPANGDDRPLLNIGYVPALPTTDPLEPATVRPPVPHVWEITANTTGIEPTPDRPWRPEYLALDRVTDTTRGLTRSGVLRFALPAGTVIYGPANDVRVDAFAGVGDRPPRVDDTAVAGRIVAWLRLRPSTPRARTSASETHFNPPGGGSLSGATSLSTETAPDVEHLRVVWTGINTVEVEQMVTRNQVTIGESNGGPDQSFQLPGTNVEPETLRIEVEEQTGWVPWNRVEDLGAISRDPQTAREARAYELDAEAGVIRLGDGVRSQIPPAGARLRVGLLRSCNGDAGNLPAGTLRTLTGNDLGNQPVGSRLEVNQLFAFTGGLASQSLRDAERSIPARLRHRERAVTAEDYRSLTEATPGVTVGRVELLPGFKPQQRFSGIPGVVTVMALPGRPLAPAPNPRADRPFLEAIHAYLDPRRPIGVELYVIGCEYVPLAVSVGVTVAAGADPDTTLQAIKDALRRVLWPLPGGGFDQNGWPLGRAVSNRELAVEVARVTGVSEVAGLNLFQRDPATRAWRAIGNPRDLREQDLQLLAWQLPELLGVVVVAADSAPLSVAAEINPFADPNAVGVPVVPDLC